MSLSVKICLIAVAILLYLDLIMICVLLLRRYKDEKFRLQKEKDKKTFLAVMQGTYNEKHKRIDDSNYKEMKQSIRVSDLYRGRIERHINVKQDEKKMIFGLRSRVVRRRAEAAVGLGLLGSENARKALENAILSEKNVPVRLYIANALSDIGAGESLPALVNSLLNSHRWYRDKVNLLIADYGIEFNTYLPQIYDSTRLEIIELIVEFSSVYPTEQLKRYLVELLDTKQVKLEAFETYYGTSGVPSCANCSYYEAADKNTSRRCKWKGEVSVDYKCSRYHLLPVSVYAASSYKRLVDKATDILATIYPKVLNDSKYLQSKDYSIRNSAVKALSAFSERENLLRILPFLKDEKSAESAVISVSQLLDKHPVYINDVVDQFVNESDPAIRQLLAQILSSRIEYFIMRLQTSNSKPAFDLLRQLLLLGRTSEVIDFLNKNKDIDLENEIVAILKDAIPYSEELRNEAITHLNERICKKCGLKHEVAILPKREEKKDKNLTLILWVVLIAVFMIVPIIYLIRRSDVLLTLSWMEQLKIFIVDFNYYLAYYSIAINTTYIGLLLLSFYQVNQQSKRWMLKQTSMLFKKRFLPSISIIAPAFNEEKTIVESANSLLNLEYPDYELIIVNDGSNDDTLDILIKYFDLIRVDYNLDYKLKTKQIRAVYMNRSMPKLIVVDKINGGKADSLNAGINISTKEYFCGIDADSLLEQDALLKLASLTLDHGIETPALGGNIFPINGCVIEQGYIKEIRLPDNKLARVQNIEYIRAFMAGRLGWASLNSLLIISGAFGLFRKDRIIGIGGYLTSSGKYEKDTVGEDMELVVRIRRLMRELGNRYKICYAYNANCWTEVPEDMESLRKQRYRWHRGLIDILIYHKKMLFNPRYGVTGMLAMPYYFLFEMIGPILEIQGYIMVVLAFILGLLNAEVTLLLFVSTILMGVFVSISSLLIAEKDTKYYKTKDLMILVLYSFLENFGLRQLISIWRVGGYLTMFRKQEGWGKPRRKGFAASDSYKKV